MSADKTLCFLLTGEKRILEMVAKGTRSQMLDSVCCVSYEEQACWFSSIDLLLVDGNRLRHGGCTESFQRASPHECHRRSGDWAFLQVRWDSRIPRGTGDDVGQTIATRSLMGGFTARRLSPTFSTRLLVHAGLLFAGKVIATFAMYYHEPRSPTPRDQETIDQITHLAGVAIERKLTQEALRRSEAYLAEAQRLTHTGSWAWSVRTGAHFLVARDLSHLRSATPRWSRPPGTFSGRVHPEDRSGNREESRNGVHAEGVDGF